MEGDVQSKREKNKNKTIPTTASNEENSGLNNTVTTKRARGEKGRRVQL